MDLRSWLVDISRRQTCDITNSYRRKMYPSRFNQRNRSSRRYILRDLSYNIGVCIARAGETRLKFTGQATRKGGLNSQAQADVVVHRQNAVFWEAWVPILRSIS